MSHYLISNAKIIEELSQLYKGKLDIDKIKEKIFTRDFGELTLVEFSKFRVFLDASLMIYNKNKLEKEYLKATKQFRYLDNFQMDLKEINYESYRNFINENYNLYLDGYAHLIIKSEPQPRNIYDEIVRLRNAFAHMQYGSFSMCGPGVISLYGIFNKDRGRLKNTGIALEPVIHEFISRYYSNQSVLGIPYKHSFISNFSFKEHEFKPHYVFTVVTFKNDSVQYIPGQIHPMIQFLGYQSDLDNEFGLQRMDDFLNSGDFRVEEQILDEKKISVLHNIIEKENGDKEHLPYLYKALCDPETEISNFFVHIRQLNDKIINCFTLYSEGKLEEGRNDILRSLDELQEDSESIIFFRYMFTILKIFNFALRLEDDDLPELDYSNFDISKFVYDDQDMIDFANDYYLRFGDQKMITHDLNKEFVCTKIRNAISHGNFKFDTNCDEVIVSFEDRWNGRVVKIQSSMRDLENFIGDSYNLQII